LWLVNFLSEQENRLQAGHWSKQSLLVVPSLHALGCANRPCHPLKATREERCVQWNNGWWHFITPAVAVVSTHWSSNDSRLHFQIYVDLLCPITIHHFLSINNYQLHER
jgi:hypothetical protein